jgi:mRNA interferase RelE/StbE
MLCNASMHKVLYHPLVEKDLDALPVTIQKRIVTTIDRKLTADPVSFGKPLRHVLRNYYSLRIGEYRVIYYLENEIVYVVLVRHRKDVYAEALKRVMRL